MCFIFFFFCFIFSSKSKYIYDFPKPKSQTPKDSKQIKYLHKIHNAQFQHKNRKLPSLNKKCQPPSLIITYSYELESNGTTLLELCDVVERLKTKSIVFGLGELEMG